MAGDLTEFRGQIDARNPAAEAICQVARRATDSAADVQNVIGGRHMESWTPTVGQGSGPDK